MSDFNVINPPHYRGEIECIDAMLQQFGREKVMAFCELNAFKYLWRCEQKHNEPFVDVGKAMWYLGKFKELGGDTGRG